MADDIERVLGLTAYDAHGAKVGVIMALHSCAATGSIEWATVVRGVAKSSHALVPLVGARIADDGVHLAVLRGLVRRAPDVTIDGALPPSDQDRLETHYGLRRTTRKPEESVSARVVVARSSGTAYQPLGTRRHRERPAGRPRRRRPERETHQRGIEVLRSEKQRERSLADRLLGWIRACLRRWTTKPH
ncbi:hypothetical protein [Kribbella lupini]|uniref:PRC-barrel domain containing protein n=1 Tax=Kribbella lupini TaxID=291602 RepID=A0ABP4LEV1_9ACTN